MFPSLQRARFPAALLLIALALHLWLVGYGIERAAFDEFAFRQAQTGMGALFMLKGGPFLAYQVPVMGAPWSIPFEFPFYQWLVALLAKAASVRTELSGRVVSAIFFYASLFPGWVILRNLGLTRARSLLMLCFWIASPIYAFWSRTVMIESTALFFSVSYFMAIVLFETTRKPRWLALIAVAGAMAALVKITTFFGFALASALYLAREPRSLFPGSARQALRLALLAVFAALIPLAAGFAWTHFADALKDQNLIARGFIRSTDLKAWNFGTLQQKLDPGTWAGYWGRTKEHVGSQITVLLAVIGLFFCSRRDRRRFAFCALVYLAVFATFTNLNSVHNYYAYAHAVFLVAAVGFVFSALATSRSHQLKAFGIICCAFFLLGSYRFYAKVYFHHHRDNPLQAYADLKQYLDTNLRPEDGIVIFGEDWSPVIPYNTSRRAIMEPGTRILDEAKLRQVVRMTENAGTPIGAALACGGVRNQMDRYSGKISAALGDAANARSMDVDGCLVFTRAGSDKP